jgi:hypothetical protein
MSLRALVGCLVALGVLAGAAGPYAIADVPIPPKYGTLNERVREYYQLEKEKNWAKAWEYRVPLYRSSVPKDTYVRLMQRDTQGWELRSYVVRKVTDDGPCVLLTMSFVETPPKDLYAHLGVRDLSSMETEDQSRWEKIDGTWYAWDTGGRAHISLASVTPPNQTSRGSPSTCSGRTQ